MSQWAVFVWCSGLFNSPGMQSMMQQMLANPQMMQSSMMAPSFQAIAANPELARQVSKGGQLDIYGFMYFAFWKVRTFFLNLNLIFIIPV